MKVYLLYAAMSGPWHRLKVKGVYTNLDMAMGIPNIHLGWERTHEGVWTATGITNKITYHYRIEEHTVEGEPE